jgi:hypothetical protein
VYTLRGALVALALPSSSASSGGFAPLVGAFFAAGLGVFNHVLMALFVPALTALVVYLAVRKPGIVWWKAVVLVLAYAAGAAPYAVLFLHHYAGIAGGLFPLDVGALRSTFAYATGTGTFGSFLFPTGLAPGEAVLAAEPRSCSPGTSPPRPSASPRGACGASGG